MLLKTKGIVLKTIKYGDSSLIADIFTQEKGRLSYIISGVRKQNSRFSAGMLQVMTILDLVVYHSEKEKLHRIKELKPAYLYQTIPFDVRKSTMLLFLAELCAKTIQEPEENERLYQFIFESLKDLDELKGSCANTHLFFMLGLAEQLGFQLQQRTAQDQQYFDMETGQFSSIIPEHKHIMTPPHSDNLAHLLEFQGQPGQCRMSRSARQKLLPQLILYFKYHIDNMHDMKSHLILSEVL